MDQIIDLKISFAYPLCGRHSTSEAGRGKKNLKKVTDEKIDLHLIVQNS